MSKLSTIYHQQKIDFLDTLQPDDLRNGESFNQAENIIDNINEALYRAVLKGENAEQFITKATENFFRENSQAQKKSIDLAYTYLKIKLETTNKN